MNASLSAIQILSEYYRRIYQINIVLLIFQSNFSVISFNLITLLANDSSDLQIDHLFQFIGFGVNYMIPDFDFCDIDIIQRSYCEWTSHTKWPYCSDSTSLLIGFCCSLFLIRLIEIRINGTISGRC
jgi:hypothetical protein